MSRFDLVPTGLAVGVIQLVTSYSLRTADAASPPPCVHLLETSIFEL